MNSKSNVRVYSDPDEAANRLHVLLGEISAGNNNPQLKNEISQLSDYLLKDGHISPADHKKLLHMSRLI